MIRKLKKMYREIREKITAAVKKAEAKKWSLESKPLWEDVRLKIRIFTMQKNESDILEDWIQYHAGIIGLENMYVIDNDSTDISLEILKKYEKIGLNLRTGLPDYRKKGDYLLNWMKQSGPNCLFFPIDLDEFICFDDGKRISCDPEFIIEEIKSLPDAGRFAFNRYITGLQDRDFYSDPLSQIRSFYISENDGRNKKFFRGDRIRQLDHGNHAGDVLGLRTDDYFVSNLSLFHFHFRGVDRLIEKCRNDIRGLKTVRNPESPEEIRKALKKKRIGSHNLQIYLEIMEKGKQSLCQDTASGYPCGALAERMAEVRREKL